MSTDSPLADLFVQATYCSPDSPGPITRIVIHGTVSPCQAGGARAVANFFARADNRSGSAHYVVDPGEIVQCVRENATAYQAPPNHGSLGVELCDPQKGLDSRWSDANHRLMLARAARLIADLCKRHNLPVVWLSPADLLAGKHGITGHVEVSQAFHQSDHTDPGSAFPRAGFVDAVNAVLHPAPAPHPTVPAWYKRLLRLQTPYLVGTDVTAAQTRLHIHADGVYGPQTAAAVKAFQTAHHLTADGVVGPATATALG